MSESRTAPLPRRGDIVDYTDRQGYTTRTVVKRVVNISGTRYYGLVGIGVLVADGVIVVPVDKARPGSYSRFTNAQAARSSLVTLPAHTREGVIAEYDAAIAVRVAIRNADVTRDAAAKAQA